jgi:hypothetical protein
MKLFTGDFAPWSSGVLMPECLCASLSVLQAAPVGIIAAIAQDDFWFAPKYF